jgi:hypothetical protein
LGNIYFIPEYTVNLVSIFQLNTELIVFDLEISCLKLFNKTEILCTIIQIYCYYIFNIILKTKSEFIEFTEYNNYLILNLLEYQLLV